MLAFRLCRRAFRYIFARSISTPLPNSRSQFPFPSPIPAPQFPSPHGSQRMPLQSLTHWRLPKDISNIETKIPAPRGRVKAAETHSPRVSREGQGTCGRRQGRIDGRKRFACFRVFSRTEHLFVSFRVVSRT